MTGDMITQLPYMLAPNMIYRLCQECYELITPKGRGWHDDMESLTCRGGVSKGEPHKPYSESEPYHSYRTNGELAAVLEELTMSGTQDEDLGEVDTFGWFAYFRDSLAILSNDSQGFVFATTYESVEESDEAWETLSRAWERWEIDEQLS